MSSEKFEHLQDEFQSLLDDIKESIETRLPKLWGEKRKKLVRDIEKQIEEAYSLLRDLEGEAQCAPHPFRSQMNMKIRNYTTVITKYDDKLRNISSNDSRNRPDPFSGQSVGFSGDNDEKFQRSRLLQTNEIIDRTSESIVRTQHVAAETDIIGNEIIEDLGQQREALLRTKEGLTDANENLSKSRKLLRLMYKRVMTNKLILILIILMEVGILIGVVYWKFFSHKK